MGTGSGIVLRTRARGARGLPWGRPRRHRPRAPRALHGGRRGVRAGPRTLREPGSPGAHPPPRDCARDRGSGARDGGTPARPAGPARTRELAPRRRPHDPPPSGGDRGAGRARRVRAALPGVESQARERRLSGPAPRRRRSERRARNGRRGEQQRPRHAGEMRTAALLGKLEAGDATANPAARMLHMATLGGALSLGLADRIGSLVPGKSADAAAIDLRGPDTQPVYDPVSQIVYAATRSHVREVWVAGRRVVRDGALETLDAEETVREAGAWRTGSGDRRGPGVGSEPRSLRDRALRAARGEVVGPVRRLPPAP